MIGILAPLDNLGADIAESIQDATDALSILATTVRERPEVADAIVAVMEGRNRHDWADRIRELTHSSNRETREVAS